jgi:uncharacterized membrane protein YccC
MLELQINAHWASRPSHLLMLNAHTLKETQQMTQQTLLTIAHALYEGNPQPILANSERLNEIVAELKQLSTNARAITWRKRRFMAMSG